MQNKPLLIAGAFAAAALIFMLWSLHAYRGAQAEADEAVTAWNATKTPRATAAALQQQAASLSPRGGTTGVDDVSAVMGQLVQAAGLPMEQLERMDRAGALSNEVAAHQVRLSSISVATMGMMLEQLHNAHKNLVVREIRMTEPKDKTPGYFTWTLTIGVPKAAPGA
jgi:hypothetical protein